MMCVSSFSAAEIKTKQDLDFEKLSKQFQDFFKLNITAIDSRGEKSQVGQLHVVVEDVPEPPTFKSKNYHLDADEDTVSNLPGGGSGGGGGYILKYILKCLPIHWLIPRPCSVTPNYLI